MSHIMHLYVDDHLAGQLDAIAHRTDRPKIWHVEQALRTYVASMQTVEDGLQDALHNRPIDHIDVVNTTTVFLDMHDEQAQRERLAHLQARIAGDEATDDSWWSDFTTDFDAHRLSPDRPLYHDTER